MPTAAVDLKALREAFELAVKRKMMSDVPWGVLLSGTADCIGNSFMSLDVLSNTYSFPTCHP